MTVFFRSFKNYSTNKKYKFGMNENEHDGIKFRLRHEIGFPFWFFSRFCSK